MNGTGPNPNILANITLYKTDQGGRKGPTPKDFFTCVLDFNGEKFSCRMYLYQIGSISPGDTVEVPITFTCPELILNRLKIGNKFKIWDGGFKGEGEVLKILT